MSAARPVFFIVSRGEIPEAALPALRMALLPIGIAARDGGLEATVGEAGLRQADARRAVLAAQWLRDAAVRAGAAPAVGVAFGGRAEAETLAASPGEVRASAPVESATRGEFGWLADGTAWRLGPGGAPALLDLRRRPPGPPADPAALAAILEAAAAGRSSWVEGDARSGKSALLDALESALEYSARHLALMEWAAALKLFNYACIGFALFLPWGTSTGEGPLALAAAIGMLAVKLAVAGAALAVVETVSAKLRVFRAPEFLATAFMLAVLGLLVHVLLKA